MYGVFPKTYSTPAKPERALKARMVDFMLERGEGGTTRADLLKRFTPKEIDEHGDAAAREATRRYSRRAA